MLAKSSSKLDSNSGQHHWPAPLATSIDTTDYFQDKNGVSCVLKHLCVFWFSGCIIHPTQYLNQCSWPMVLVSGAGQQC
jgi:hypothetical protein